MTSDQQPGLPPKGSPTCRHVANGERMCADCMSTTLRVTERYAERIDADTPVVEAAIEWACAEIGGGPQRQKEAYAALIAAVETHLQWRHARHGD